MTNIMSKNDDTTIFGGSGEDQSSFWYDTYSSSPDTIKFTMMENKNGTLNISKEIVGSVVPGGLGDDGFRLTSNVEVPSLPEAPSNENGFWKYNEDVVLKEIRDYLSGTYRSHYASAESKTQTLDLIESVGDAEPFCRSNAIKYLSRFGKKNGKSKQDILKAIHYCILLYHFAGLCNENSQPYETF